MLKLSLSIRTSMSKFISLLTLFLVTGKRKSQRSTLCMPPLMRSFVPLRNFLLENCHRSNAETRADN